MVFAGLLLLHPEKRARRRDHLQAQRRGDDGADEMLLLSKMKKILAILLFLASPSWAGFTKAQTGCTNGTAVANATSLGCTLTNNPAATDLLVCAVMYYNGSATPPASMAIADSNSNSYTKSAHSPAKTNGAGAGMEYLFYILSAAANASKTITATFSSYGASGAAAIFCDDITVTGGTVSLDSDTPGSGSGTAVSSPTVTVNGTGDFLYSGAAIAHEITSANLPWTLGGDGVDSVTFSASEYDLSASANTAVNYTQNQTGLWDAMAASFLLTGTTTTTTPTTTTTTTTLASATVGAVLGSGVIVGGGF